MHPVACKNLCPLIFQCFAAVDWMRKGTPPTKKTHINTAYYQGAIGLQERLLQQFLKLYFLLTGLTKCNSR